MGYASTEGGYCKQAVSYVLPVYPPVDVRYLWLLPYSVYLLWLWWSAGAFKISLKNRYVEFTFFMLLGLAFSGT